MSRRSNEIYLGDSIRNVYILTGSHISGLQKAKDLGLNPYDKRVIIASNYHHLEGRTVHIGDKYFTTYNCHPDIFDYFKMIVMSRGHILNQKYNIIL